MTTSAHARVGDAFDLLKVGLRPFIERELLAQRGEKWISEVRGILTDPRLQRIRDDGGEDIIPLLVIMERAWGTVFRRILGKAERTLVNELIAFRERWTNPEEFTADDAVRALDSAARLLAAVSAPEALEVDKMTGDLRQAAIEEEQAGQPRAADSAIVCEATGVLKSWREVVRPSRSVASGAFRVSDFSADIWQVYRGEAVDEYQKPAEFFRRTYLTESLKALLVGALSRFADSGGDPVVQLQTHFGGGKTHALLALYHLFSGAPMKALPGIEGILKDGGGQPTHSVKRVVLAGNRISPGTPSVKEDGTIVRTLWGELAWQLGYAAGDLKGARKAFHRVASHDEKGTNPGDDLRQLLSDHGPCLILIDEWVAYARQLRGEEGLPGGRFDTQFAFARSLVEAARLAKRCLVVVSLPAFEFTGTAQQRDDDQVGGQRGREALNRLYQAIGSAGASWRPATAREEIEIVRQRLFEPLLDPAQLAARDTVAGSYFDLYARRHEFPSETRLADYEARLKAAYPIHPEVFDRLYSDWSRLPKFQRTRGVLRLLAAAVHCLWDIGDRNALIMPGTLPLDDHRVQFELTRFLPQEWPEVAAEADGPVSVAARLDAETPAFGKAAAARRVARTVLLGSSPAAPAAGLGIDESRMRLGCVMPTETSAIFGEALLRLAAEAPHLHREGQRSWFAAEARASTVAEPAAEAVVAAAPTEAAAVTAAAEGEAASATDAAANPTEPTAAGAPQSRRFRGAVRLDPICVAADADRVADRVIAHLIGLEGADIHVTLQIEANLPHGATNSLLNTVSENSRELDFLTVSFD